MTTEKVNRRIVVTVSEYRGDADFPEAARYGEFVQQSLQDRYPGYEIEVTTDIQTSVRVYGGEIESYDIAAEIAPLIKVELWDEFCGDGYKAYRTVTDDQIRALCDEARSAGDEAQVALCERALRGDEAARIACVDAIEEGQA